MTDRMLESKTDLERIADYLEQSIGIVPEDKGYLDEKVYIQRIADAVEQGAGGSGGGGGAIAYTAGENIRIRGYEISAPGVATKQEVTGIHTTLQDHIDDVNTALASKQGTLIAGDNIGLSGNTISAIDTTYTAGDGIDISSSHVIKAIMNSSNTYTKAEVNALVAALNHLQLVVAATRPAAGEDNKLYLIGNNTDGYEQYVYINSGWVDLGAADVDLTGFLTADEIAAQYQKKLTAGDNITINATTNAISATNTTYSAGTGITITGAANAINAERNATNTYTKTEVDDLLVRKIVDTTSTNVTLAKALKNRVYVYTQPLTSLTVTEVEDGITDIIFKSGATATTLNLPSSILKPSGFTVEANKTYELNIMNNLLLVGEWVA